MIKTDSRKLLNALGRWCELTTPLSDRYQTFSLTGKARAGDSSGFISSGKIEASEEDYSGVKLAAKHISRAEQAYAEHRQMMLRHATESLTL